MPKIEEDVPLEERRQLLTEGVEQALKLVQASLAQLTSARESLRIEAREDSGYGDMLYVAAAGNSMAASYGMAEAQTIIDDLLLERDEEEEQ